MWTWRRVRGSAGKVAAAEPVAIRGMGLCFFDHLAMLTVDRGGRFDDVDGRLVYRPSGHEPVIYAGSRRGVPYHARGENEKGVSGRHQPVFLTPEVIDRFRVRTGRGHPARFRAEVWPLVAGEVELVYYRTLIDRRTGRAAADEFTEQFVGELRARLTEQFGQRSADGDRSWVARLLTGYGIGARDRWDWDRVAEPHAGRRFASPREFRGWTRSRPPLTSCATSATRSGSSSTTVA